MSCETIKLPNGATAIVCGPRRPRKKCRFCGAAATLLCDFANTIDSSDPSTCDKPLCERCAMHEDNLDLCPDHPKRAPPRGRQLALAL